MAASETTTTFLAVHSEVKQLTPPAGTADVLGWLGEKEADQESPRDAGLRWLLATSYGAVVWGLKRDGRWVLSDEDARLPADALLDLRAFGPDGEVFIWRDGDGLRARRRTDNPKGELDTLEETQLLWGTQRDTDRPAPPGFTPLSDGDQGLRHAPPLELDESYFVPPAQEGQKEDSRYGHRPARLRLRHYVAKDKDTGVARIVDTRLVEVLAKKPREEVKQDEPSA